MKVWKYFRRKITSTVFLCFSVREFVKTLTNPGPNFNGLFPSGYLGFSLKELGKCYRDPDYTDPWPIGHSGQYVADELNAVFDSGAYKPEKGRKRAASAQVSVRVPAQNPAVANTNQVLTRVAAPVNQQRSVVQQQRPYREIAATPQLISSQPIQQQSCGVRNYVSKKFFYRLWGSENLFP